MAILDLTSHPYVWVTVAELAEYWRVSVAWIVEEIAAGNIEAIQIRPGAFRIRCAAAIAFEQRGRVSPVRPWPAAFEPAPSTPPDAADPADVPTPKEPHRTLRPVIRRTDD